LSNAVQFADEGGAIDVVIKPAGHLVSLVIRDTAQGIRPEFPLFVFDRFRQGDSSSTKRFGGLGLGLSLVQDLVKLHGGSVTAESPGVSQGAAFTVTFPIA
jgi:signal transduction histidine kinase